MSMILISLLFSFSSVLCGLALLSDKVGKPVGCFISNNNFKWMLTYLFLVCPPFFVPVYDYDLLKYLWVHVDPCPLSESIRWVQQCVVNIISSANTRNALVFLEKSLIGLRTRNIFAGAMKFQVAMVCSTVPTAKLLRGHGIFKINVVFYPNLKWHYNKVLLFLLSLCIKSLRPVKKGRAEK